MSDSVSVSVLEVGSVARAHLNEPNNEPVLNGISKLKRNCFEIQLKGGETVREKSSFGIYRRVRTK